MISSSPLVLYHYTSADGLKGIIESNSIWATDYRFLNDSREFNYGAELFEELLVSRESELMRLRDGRLFNIVKDIHSALMKTDDVRGRKPCVFISSFTEEPDLLSQWRGYNQGRGFSLGLNVPWLYANAMAQKFNLYPVIYDIDSQVAELRVKIDLLAPMALADPATDDFQLAFNWLTQVMSTVARLKHPAFREEKEHRAVSISSTWPSECKVRTSFAGLVPYIPLLLGKVKPFEAARNPQNLGFESIVIGPSLLDHQKIAVDALLALQKMRFSVTKSEIPFVAV